MQGEGLLTQRRTWRRNRVAVPLAFALVMTQMTLLPFGSPAAHAQAPESCTEDAAALRAEIDTADFGATVEVLPGTYYLTNGPLTISKNIMIVGLGATSADVVIDACRSSRVFDVVSSGTSGGNGVAHIANLR